MDPISRKELRHNTCFASRSLGPNEVPRQITKGGEQFSLKISTAVFG